MASFGIPDLSAQLESDLAIRMAEVESMLRQQIEGKYPLVIETSRHLVEAGGKRLRPLLTLITSHYGDSRAHGEEGFRFFTQTKVITSRWLDPSHGGINLGFPQN